MSNKTITIATRKSPLALWQANHIRTLLMQHWPTLKVELLPMQTSGDKFYKQKLLSLGGKGLFVKELEEALLDKRADLAVHSMKDVPSELPNQLEINCICKRGNPFDALLSLSHSSLNALPKAAVVGTSSLRRQSQLLAFRNDLIIKPIRGNIQTRMNTIKAGECDAILLAAAGLERMNMQHLITETLNEDIMLPACGQGVLGIECRKDDDELHNLLSPLNDALSSACTQAERHVNSLLGGNCHTPVAVYCKPRANNNMVLSAKVLTPDGQHVMTNSQHGTLNEIMKLAKQCAEALISKGALKLIQSIHHV